LELIFYSILKVWICFSARRWSSASSVEPQLLVQRKLVNGHIKPPAFPVVVDWQLRNHGVSGQLQGVREKTVEVEMGGRKFD